MSQARQATGNNQARAVLRQLLGELDLAAVPIQADSLLTVKTNRKSLHRQIHSPFPVSLDNPFGGNGSPDQPQSERHLNALGQTGPRAHR